MMLSGRFVVLFLATARDGTDSELMLWPSNILKVKRIYQFLWAFKAFLRSEVLMVVTMKTVLWYVML
jgi:hypothetical protein